MIRLWKRCPFPAFVLVYVGIIGATAVVGSQVPSLRGIGVPLFGSVLATLAFAVVVEKRRQRPNSCPWLDFEGFARVTLYLALFVVSVSVVLPGIWPTPGVEWPLRIPAALLAVALPSLLAVHLKVDHSELEQVGVRRSLVFASRLPLFFLVTVTVLVFGASLITLFAALLGLL